MIYPKKNFIIRWVFQVYGRWITQGNFKAINFNTIEVDANKSVLLISNHFGWWDAFILYWVNSLLFKKQFHVMILEETAKRESILKYGGAFSISKQSRDVVESLNFTAKLLNEPGNLVLMFPQGKLHSNFITDIVFEKGIMKILGDAAGKYQMVFAATFVENFQYKKSSAYVYIKNADGNYENIDKLQAAYQQHYNAARLQQTQIVI